ncbi:unnamed protein product [Onchocerca ochengi]|uniref:Cullin domain-containing protein n=1 Tax=Onchocerca ochengi TaxID=42157 RepID=A0A182EW28_ONCOC|nr:unnamed protein product [Onchocerca ochengi]
MEEILFALLIISFCFITINGTPTVATPTGENEGTIEETTENTSQRSIPTVDEILEDLENGLKEVYNQQTMNRTRYMQLYSRVYDLYTSVPCDTDSFTDVHKHFAKFGSNLYKHLKHFLQNHVENVYQKGSDLNDENLLNYFTTQWDSYRFNSKVMRGIFNYLNRDWIELELDEGNKKIYEIYVVMITFDYFKIKHRSLP